MRRNGQAVYRRDNTLLLKAFINRKAKENASKENALIPQFASEINNRLELLVSEMRRLFSKINGNETSLEIDTGYNEKLGVLLSETSKIVEQISNLPFNITKIENLLDEIKKKDMVVNIPAPQKILFPQVQKIEGEVKVTNPQERIDFSPIIDKLDKLNASLSKIKVSFPEIKLPKIEIPKSPTSISLNESDKIIKSLDKLSDLISDLPSKIKIPKVDFPNSVSVNNFPPQKYPMPVTHISINSVNGYVKSTAVTVTTALTPLPPEVLANRRSLVIYNNSSQTVEIGGSTFTFGDGVPVPQGTFSPAFESGEKTIVYGRVSSSTADVRVLEISDEASGR